MAKSSRMFLRKYSNYRSSLFRKIHKGEITMDEEKLHQNFSEEKDVEIVEEIIVKNTEIARNHLTPEIKLHLLTPNCRLYHEPYSNEITKNSTDKYFDTKTIFDDPFWSIYWPGGQALTRFVLDHGNELLNDSEKGTNFLDIGSGCGATSIAAKIIGATKVIANDIDNVACIAAKLNAKLNNVDIAITSENLLENGASTYESSLDVILVGDLLYDEEIAESLIPWLEKASQENGSRIYLGDPGRHALTEALKRRLKFRKKYSLPENVRRENYGYNAANVWQFER